MGEFEMLDDSVVHDDNALEIEALIYEIKPHDVETIGLNDSEDEEDEEQDEDEEEAPEEDANVQLTDDVNEKYFTPEMDGHGGLGESVYQRIVPAKYEDGDNFMASMVKNYALEGKNEDGTPDGKFYMNEARLKAAA